MVRINPETLSLSETTKPRDLEAILAAQRAAFNLNPNPNWASRKAKLETLRDLILGHEAEFVQAISDDFGHRAVEDTLISEFLVIQGSVPGTTPCNSPLCRSSARLGRGTVRC